MDKLQNEFVEYQLLEDGDIPQSVWDHACVSKKEDGVVIKYHRMNAIKVKNKVIEVFLCHIKRNILGVKAYLFTL